VWVRSDLAEEVPSVGSRADGSGADGSRADGSGADGSPTPALSPQDAIRTINRGVLERRCVELERSRDEIWRQLMVVQTSRSWRLTRPLRDFGARLRSLRRSP
jgi:hypothetical protein